MNFFNKFFIYNSKSIIVFSFQIFNQLGIDVSPKRLINEDFPPIGSVSVETRPGSVTSKDDMEWFKTKIHREKPLESEELLESETVVSSPVAVGNEKENF